MCQTYVITILCNLISVNKISTFILVTLASKTNVLLDDALIEGFGVYFGLTPQQRDQCRRGKYGKKKRRFSKQQKRCVRTGSALCYFAPVKPVKSVPFLEAIKLLSFPNA